MKEIWKDIKGYEGFYQVSNYGRVKSLDRFVKHNKGGYKLLKSQYIKYSKNKLGYCKVCLCMNNDKRYFTVHRLVATAFIPNPNNYPFINHKDENPSNNFVWVNDDGTVDLDKSNLEWCTISYNVRYGNAINKRVNKVSKPVLQYNLDGSYVNVYNSINEIQRKLNYSTANILSCCKGKYKQAYGYIWRYKEKEGD